MRGKFPAPSMLRSSTERQGRKVWSKMPEHKDPPSLAVGEQKLNEAGPSFKSLLQGDFVSDAEKVCAKCGREFSDPLSAKRPHLTRGGTDCDPRTHP